MGHYRIVVHHGKASILLAETVAVIELDGGVGNCIPMELRVTLNSCHHFKLLNFVAGLC